MTPKVDYYTSLSRSIARLDRDSYEARGAVYDRALSSLLKRMSASDPPYTDIEIAREKRAFKDAIRRIEFGESTPEWEPEEPSPPPAPRDLDLEGPPHVAAPPIDMAEAEEAAAPLAYDLHVPARDMAPEPAPEPKRKRRSVAGRVAGRVLFAALLLGLGSIAYSFISDDPDLKGLFKRAGNGSSSAMPIAASSQKAIVFDGDPSKPDGTKVAGTAQWQLRSETSDAQGKPATVLAVDLAIPDRKIIMKLVMRRDTAGAMSHLVDIKFVRPDQQPDEDISDIGGIVMTTSEHVRRAVLAGQVVKVTPGVFLFGLSTSDLERNLDFLRELTWLDIPITYRNGAHGVIGIEKGESGERAINEAVAKWTQ